MKVTRFVILILLLSALLQPCAAQSVSDTISLREAVQASQTDLDPDYLQDEGDDSFSSSEETDEAEEEVEAEEEAEEEEAPSALRSISGEDWQKILSDSLFRYTREKEKIPAPPKAPKRPVADEAYRWFNSGLLKALLYLLVVAAAIFVLYSLFSQSNLKWWQKKQARDSDNGNLNEEPDVQDVEDPDKLLRQALADKNFRLAVRIHYLHLLFRLQERGLIIHRSEKTNWDYVRELRAQPFAASFTELTRYFDYIWYGEFSIDEAAYLQLCEKFSQLNQQVPGS